ncbi:hypothetical protein C8J56DRAFT_796936 [Mycena floridula]|nr:hypothetical protein C8J56DRAFT_796936 [Mycena floridula]
MCSVDWNSAEEHISDPALSVGAGYGESKWCVELILANASESTPLKPIIVRVGQLNGGFNGYWNENEWFPSLVRSSRYSNVSQLSKDAFRGSRFDPDKQSHAVVELRNSPHQYLHLLHPNPVPASTIFDSLAQLMNLRLVSYDDWLSKLQKSAPEALSTENPAVNCWISFKQLHRTLLTASGEAFGHPALASDSAQESSVILRELRMQPLGEKDIKQWLKYWE